VPKICAIHQPNFFPWLGYFDKIRRADVFVFLDDVQIQKTGSSWVNRTKLNCFGREKWYTCPIKRLQGYTNIDQAEFNNSQWKQEFTEVLLNYYKKFPNFSDTYELVDTLINQKDYKYLSDLNKDIILAIANKLGYSTTFVSKSDLKITTNSSRMLIDVCKAVEADTYICGGGASGYQDDAAFEEAGLKLVYQNYVPSPYGDPDNYIAGLSVIDYLMSV
jgi:hypothetical protein